MNDLPAEAGIHRHHQDEVDIGGDLFDRRHRRRRVEDHAGLGAELLDLRDGAMQVRQHLDVHRHHVRAGIDERLDVAIGIADHQVHVERQRGRLAQRLHDRHADGDVGHEVSVHHVDVDLIGAAARRGGDLGAEVREVRGENRRRETNRCPERDVMRASRA